MRWIAWLALMATFGCTSVRYALPRPGLQCDRALRVTHRTMVALGYEIDEMISPVASGVGTVAGHKTGPKGEPLSGRVDIRCDVNGAVLQPVESGPFTGFDFSRAFDYSFRELVQRPDLEVPAKAIGLQVLVERIDRYQAQLDMGGVPTTGDVFPVRVTVRNHTDRAVTIDPSGIKLAAEGGKATTPLDGAALTGALASGVAGDHVRANLLTHATIPANTSVTRFLVYPAGPSPYREAQISIEDAETGESEGFFTHVE